VLVYLTTALLLAVSFIGGQKVDRCFMGGMEVANIFGNGQKVFQKNMETPDNHLIVAPDMLWYPYQGETHIVEIITNKDWTAE
jgi:hypothetical protein